MLSCNCRWSSSTAHTSNEESRVVEIKKDQINSSGASSNISTQLKTAASVFLSVLKTGVSNSSFSVSNLVKKVPLVENSRLSEAPGQKKSQETSVHHAEKQSEAKSGLAFYAKLMGRGDTNKAPEAPAVPRWKLKRRSVSQESIDARTKHVVTSVAKAVTKPSLLLRLEDMCHHLFQYPQAKSLASRVNKILKSICLVFNCFILVAMKGGCCFNASPP